MNQLANLLVVRPVIFIDHWRYPEFPYLFFLFIIIIRNLYGRVSRLRRGRFSPGTGALRKSDSRGVDIGLVASRQSSRGGGRGEGRVAFSRSGEKRSSRAAWFSPKRRMLRAHARMSIRTHSKLALKFSIIRREF